MKKTIISFLVLALAVLPAGAQNWRIGLEGGASYNRSDFDKQYMVDFRNENLWGAGASVFGQYNFLDWLGVRAEFNYIQKNQRLYRTDSFFTDYDYKVKNSYFQIPLMANFSFGGEHLRGFVNLGVYGAYWFQRLRQGTMPSSDTYLLHTDCDAPETVNDNSFNSDRDRRFDFGLAGGTGLDWLINDHWGVQAEARVYYGLLSTVNPRTVYKTYRYNTTLALLGGVYYKF